MTNKTFMRLTDTEKREKLKRTLWRKTGGRLLPTELKAVVGRIPLERQYEVRIYRSSVEFQKELVLPSGVVGRMIVGFGPEYYSNQAVVLVTTTLTHQRGKLHIFVPPNRMRQTVSGIN